MPTVEKLYSIGLQLSSVMCVSLNLVTNEAKALRHFDDVIQQHGEGLKDEIFMQIRIGSYSSEAGLPLYHIRL